MHANKINFGVYLHKKVKDLASFFCHTGPIANVGVLANVGDDDFFVGGNANKGLWSI
jgi:hypothetical protein